MVGARQSVAACLGGVDALVVRLPRQIGQKEIRFAQLLSGEPKIEEVASAPVAKIERVTLERRVEMLEAEVERLRQQFEQFRKQFE